MTNERTLVRVALVEDDALQRAALTQLISSFSSMTLVGSAKNYAEAFVLRALSPDLWLMDLGLPDGNGFQLIRDVREQSPTSQILVFSQFNDAERVVQAIEAGAHGYIQKSTNLSELAAAVDSLMNGGAPISPSIAGHILTRVRSNKNANAKLTAKAALSLTTRERAILETLAKGLSYKEVATVHELSQHTVGDHVKAIYRKLQVNSRGEAIFEAVQSGILEIQPRAAAQK